MHPENDFKPKSKPIKRALITIFLLVFTLVQLNAATVSDNEAYKAASKWLKTNHCPLGTKLADTIKETITFNNENNIPICHVVNLSPTGYLIMAADDQVEPVIAFSAKGHITQNSDLIYFRAMKKDINQRIQFANEITANTTLHKKYHKLAQKQQHAKSYWNYLLSATNKLKQDDEFEANDIIVKPLLQTVWGYGNLNGQACYNYYNPYLDADGNLVWDKGNNQNYIHESYCVAAGQILRFHEFPTEGPGSGQGSAWTTNEDHGTTATHNFLGGDEKGGPYKWDLMTLEPDTETPAENRAQISALLFDISINSNAWFAPDGYILSRWIFDNIFSKDEYGYKNGIHCQTEFDVDVAPDSPEMDKIRKMIVPNIHSGNPVIIAFAGGEHTLLFHQAVVDGYGNLGYSTYYHVNMGRNGNGDSWYILPDITYPSRFSVLDHIYYNIFPHDTGEILAGRVVDKDGEPVQNMTITVSNTQGFNQTTKSNIYGAWAMIVAENTSYTVTCEATEETHEPETGKSSSEAPYDVGNVYGLDFVVPRPPTIKTNHKEIIVNTVKGMNADPTSLLAWNHGEYGTITYTVEDDQDWVSCSPENGTSKDATQKNTIDLTFATEDLDVGSYEATITITDPNANQSPYEIDLILNVLDKSFITLTSSSPNWQTKELAGNFALNLYCDPGANLSEEVFYITNAGTENSVLNYFISSDCSWLSMSQNQGQSIDANDLSEVKLTFNTANLPVAQYTGKIIISDSNAYNSPCTIDITLDVGPQIPTENLFAALFGGNNISHVVNTNNSISFQPDASGLNNDLYQKNKNKMPLLKKNLEGYSVKYFNGKSSLYHKGALNLGETTPYLGQTIVISFKTSDEITKPQVLFSLGNKASGTNVILANSMLHINTWAVSNQSTLPITITQSVLQNEFYRLTIVSDLADNSFKAFLNGSEIASQSGLFEIHFNYTDLAIGNSLKKTFINTGLKKAKGFIGIICDLLCYNEALSNTNIDLADDFLRKKYTKTFQAMNDYTMKLDSESGVELASSNTVVKDWQAQSSSQISFKQNSCNNAPALQNSVKLNSTTTLDCRAIKFDGEDDLLCASNCPEINSAKTPYTERSIYLVVKTGEDIQTPQIIWAEGNKQSGLNICIEQSSLKANAWNLKQSQGVTAWGAISISNNNIEANTLYIICVTFDQPNRTLSGYAINLSNATSQLSMGEVTASGALPRHQGASLGGSKTTTYGCGTGAKGNYFCGSILYALLYNDVLEEEDQLNVINLLKEKYQ